MAGSDCAVDEPADAGSPARHHDPHAASGAGPDRQPAGAAAQPPEGGVRAVSLSAVIPGREANPESRDSGSGPSGHPGMTTAKARNKQRPGKPGRFCILDANGEALNPSVLLEEARKFLLEARHAAAAVEELLRAAGPG